MKIKILYIRYFIGWCFTHRYKKNVSEPACLAEWYENEYAAKCVDEEA